MTGRGTARRAAGRRRPRGSVLALALAVLALGAPAVGGAQEPGLATLRVEREDGSVEPVRISTERGYATVPLSTLEALGWSATETDGTIALRAGARAEATFRLGSPFFRWDGVPLQLVDAPYRDVGQAWLPLQLLVDVFPEHLPEYYDFDAASSTLRAGDPTGGGARAGSRATGSDAGKAGSGAEAPSGGATGQATPGGPSATDGVPDLTAPSPYEGVRVVWIDAGHGGADPGAIGPGGIREKDVALGIARRLAAILRSHDRIEVRMTREDDSFVDLWERGLLATEAKGERPGVFVSIHGNSFPPRRGTRGFETYFLSEARTDDERRVAAIENAPLSIRGRGIDANRQSDLDFILRELRNLDHQHWSALLAEMVQEELGEFHPGPNRGVKQAPLAVLTNALMPSVLVEIGFLSNEQEARLVSRDDFQDQAAEAIAEAIRRFLERYPPGSGLGGR